MTAPAGEGSPDEAFVELERATVTYGGGVRAVHALAETSLRGAELVELWDQLVQLLVGMAQLGMAHGDLSAYNLLLHDGRLIMIDTPQVIDVIANPRGAEFLDRDAANVTRWFVAHGLGDVRPRPHELPGLLHAEARLR